MANGLFESPVMVMERRRQEQAAAMARMMNSGGTWEQKGGRGAAVLLNKLFGGDTPQEVDESSTREIRNLDRGQQAISPNASITKGGSYSQGILDQQAQATSGQRQGAFDKLSLPVQEAQEISDVMQGSEMSYDGLRSVARKLQGLGYTKQAFAMAQQAETMKPAAAEQATDVNGVRRYTTGPNKSSQVFEGVKKEEKGLTEFQKASLRKDFTGASVDKYLKDPTSTLVPLPKNGEKDKFARTQAQEEFMPKLVSELGKFGLNNVADMVDKSVITVKEATDALKDARKTEQTRKFALDKLKSNTPTTETEQKTYNLKVMGEYRTQTTKIVEAQEKVAIVQTMLGRRDLAGAKLAIENAMSSALGIAAPKSKAALEGWLAQRQGSLGQRVESSLASFFDGAMTDDIADDMGQLISAYSQDVLNPKIDKINNGFKDVVVGGEYPSFFLKGSASNASVNFAGDSADVSGLSNEALFE